MGPSASAQLQEIKQNLHMGGAELEIHLLSILTINPLNMRKKIVAISGEMLAVLPREAVSAPSLAVLTARLDGSK